MPCWLGSNPNGPSSNPYGLPTRHMSANDMSVQRPTSRYVATCRDISPTCRMTCRDISKCVIFKYADICHVKQHVGATICREMSRDVADISIDMSRHFTTCRDISRMDIVHRLIKLVLIHKNTYGSDKLKCALPGFWRRHTPHLNPYQPGF